MLGGPLILVDVMTYAKVKNLRESGDGSEPRWGEGEKQER